MARAIKAYVTGKVQGVYFRAWTRDQARQIGLDGFVRNLPDGRVEAVAAGDEAKIDAFLEQLRQGSPASRVDKVEHEEYRGDAQFSGFDIRY